MLDVSTLEKYQSRFAAFRTAIEVLFKPEEYQDIISEINEIEDIMHAFRKKRIYHLSMSADDNIRTAADALSSTLIRETEIVLFLRHVLREIIHPTDFATMYTQPSSRNRI